MTAILVVSVLAMLTASASATDYYVRTGGLDDASRSGLTNNDATAWKTIQYAIDRAEVTAGDTIHVAAGDYSENVNVNKAHLTLQGEGMDVVTVTAASADDHVFEVTEDYVNISGFKVTGATGGWIGGIYLYSADHCNISNNNASSNYFGIRLDSLSNFNTLTSNTANSNTQFGIRLDSSSDNTLTSNTANSNDHSGILLASHSCNFNTLTSNTANSNDHSGILLMTSSHTLTSNTANSNDHGIYLSNSDDNNVSCNWVQNNNVNGLRLDSGSTGNIIERNNIITNGVSQGEGIYHYQFYNSQNDLVDAKNNYWGTNDNDQIDASIYDNEEGKGTVTFLPKLEGASSCAPVPELATIVLFSVGLLMLAGYVGLRRKE